MACRLERVKRRNRRERFTIRCRHASPRSSGRRGAGSKWAGRGAALCLGGRPSWPLCGLEARTPTGRVLPITGSCRRSVSRIGLPCPGARSPQGWLPRLGRQARRRQSRPLAHPPLRPARRGLCPPLPRLTRQYASPVPSGEEKGASRLYRVCEALLERLIIKLCSSLTNTACKHRGGSLT